MFKIKSAILIDNSEIDNFINCEILKHYGVEDICVFRTAKEALIFLNETTINYQLILVGFYMPMMTGFEFIDKYRELELYNKHGKLILLSAFFSPVDIEIANMKHIKFIEKPLTMKKVLINI